jgi:hypothetical protein
MHGKTRTILCLLLGLSVAGLLAERVQAFVSAPPTDFDDAYMFVRYAKHALSGQWLAWNLGAPRVYGTTSLLHLVLVTLAQGLWGGQATALHLASGIAALLLMMALAAGCAHFGAGTHRGLQFLLWAGLLLVLLGHRDTFFFHAHLGMDTMVAALGNTLLAAAALRLAARPSTGMAVLTALLGLLSVEARPDNLIVAGLCPLLALGLLASGPRLRPLLVWAGSFIVLLGLDGLIKWRLLGTPLPLAFYAKQPGHYQGFAGEFTWNPFWFLHVALACVWPFLLALVMGVRRSNLRLLLVLGLPAVCTWMALFSVNQIMGHLGRFYFPSLPLIVLAGALLAGDWVHGLPGRLATAESAPSLARGLVLRLGLGLVLLLGGAQVLDAAGTWYQARTNQQKLARLDGFQVSATTALPQLDSWQSSQEMGLFAAQAPAGTRFAMSEHGLAGAMAPQATIIDVLGLHDPVFAKSPFTAAELWRRHPDVLWMPHPDHTQMVRDLLDSDELWQRYDFYPDAFTYGLALRKDSPHFARLMTLLEARWQAVYPGLAMAEYRAVRDNGQY